MEDAEGQHVQQDKLHQHAVHVQRGQTQWHVPLDHHVQHVVLLDHHVQHHVQHLVPLDQHVLLDHHVQQDQHVQHVVQQDHLVVG